MGEGGRGNEREIKKNRRGKGRGTKRENKIK
jgi:hypothetical protein